LPVEEQFEGFDLESLSGFGQCRGGGQGVVGQVRAQSSGQRSPHGPVAGRAGAVRAAEQAQGELEIDHGGGGQFPAALFPAAGGLDDLLEEFRGDLAGQCAEPDLVRDPGRGRVWFGSRLGRGGEDGRGRQRSSAADNM
jgi:hypothetical protein